MKKTFLLVVSSIVLMLSLSSCGEDEIIYRDYYVDNYINTMTTTRVTISENEWTESPIRWNDQYFFFCEKNLTELSPKVLANSAISVYMQFGEDNYPELFQLPDVKTYYFDNEATGEQDTYTVTTSYELFSPNTIRFKIETSNLQYFLDDDIVERRFKIVIINP